MDRLGLGLYGWKVGGQAMSMKIGIRAWIDFAFRKIFGKPGNEICLTSLRNAVLKLPRPVVSVEYLNPFGNKDFETDKLVCVDVKATDAIGRVFVIEIQIVIHSSFAKRAVLLDLGERQEKNYLPRGIIGRMRISYLARVSERSSRLLSSFISFFGTMTPIG